MNTCLAWNSPRIPAHSLRRRRLHCQLRSAQSSQYELGTSRERWWQHFFGDTSKKFWLSLHNGNHKYTSETTNKNLKVNETTSTTIGEYDNDDVNAGVQRGVKRAIKTKQYESDRVDQQQHAHTLGLWLGLAARSLLALALHAPLALR